MAATYTFDVFSSLDGFGSASGGDWGGYWGKQGPELLDHRLALYSEEQRMVMGPTRIGSSHRCWPRVPSAPSERPVGHPDGGPAGDRRLEHAGRTPRLAK